MRIPLIEYTSVRQKDGSRKTVSSYGPLTISQEDFTEIKERMKLLTLLKERSHNHCKNCKEKEGYGCTGCLWEQFLFHTTSAEKILQGVLQALGKEELIEKTNWEKEECEKSLEDFRKYLAVASPYEYVDYITNLKEAKWRVKNG